MNTVIIDRENIVIFQKDNFKPITRPILKSVYDEILDCYKITLSDASTYFVDVPEIFVFAISVYYCTDNVETVSRTVMFFDSKDSVILYNAFLLNLTIDGLNVQIMQVKNLVISDTDFNSSSEYYEIDPIGRLIRQVNLPAVVVDCPEIFNYLGEIDEEPMYNVTEKCYIRVRKPIVDGVLYYKNNEIHHVPNTVLDIIPLDDPNMIIYGGFNESESQTYLEESETLIPNNNIDQSEEPESLI